MVLLLPLALQGACLGAHSTRPNLQLVATKLIHRWSLLKTNDLRTIRYSCNNVSALYFCCILSPACCGASQFVWDAVALVSTVCIQKFPFFAPNIVVLVVSPSGKISIVDVVVPHPAQQVHVSPVCTCAVYCVARAEVAKVAYFRRVGER
jgi:hypothetical protein